MSGSLSESVAKLQADVAALREGHNVVIRTLKDWGDALEVTLRMTGLETCERCGSTRGAREVTLIGHYYTVMCHKCRNEWTEHIVDTPAFVEAVALGSEQKHYESGGDRKTLASQIKLEAVHKQLRTAAAQFVHVTEVSDE